MKSFLYAFRGLHRAVSSERNMRIHLCFSFYIIIAGLVCRLSAVEWAVVLICIGLVTAFESMNTALETLCDEVRPEKNRGIKNVKDLSAGAVLCAAIAAAVAGCAIFLNYEKISAALDFLKTQSVLSGAILLSVIPAAIFAFHPSAKKHK